MTPDPSILGWRRKPSGPPHDLRGLLFGDAPMEAWPAGGAVTDAFPWSAFVAARHHLAAGDAKAAVALWRCIADSADVESRHRLQAWHFLRANAVEPDPDLATQVLGVVADVWVDEGFDVLAAYADHTARYLNFSGSAVVWEHADASLDASIDRLLAASRETVRRIGPWTGGRLGVPARGAVRLSFLTPSGLHFGEGPSEVMWKEPMAIEVLDAATELMRQLVAKAPPRRAS